MAYRIARLDVRGPTIDDIIGFWKNVNDAGRPYNQADNIKIFQKILETKISFEGSYLWTVNIPVSSKSVHPNPKKNPKIKHIHLNDSQRIDIQVNGKILIPSNEEISKEYGNYTNNKRDSSCNVALINLQLEPIDKSKYIIRLQKGGLLQVLYTPNSFSIYEISGCRTFKLD